MNHKNNKRSEATKNKIKQTLIEMLKEEDLNKITVLSLCEKANINRSTFYNHYSSPKAILLGMQKEFLNTVSTQLTEASKVTPEWDKQSMKLLITTINEYIQDNLETCRVLGNRNLCPNMASMLFNDEIVQKHMEHFIHGDYVNEQKEYLYDFIFHGYFNTLSSWMKRDCDLSPQELAELLENIISKF